MSDNGIVQEVIVVKDEYDLTDVKSRLPFFYTARGKLIKAGGNRVSSKNAAELFNQISEVQSHGGKIAYVTQDFTVIMSAELSLFMRVHGLVAPIMLAGHTLGVVEG